MKYKVYVEFKKLLNKLHYGYLPDDYLNILHMISFIECIDEVGTMNRIYEHLMSI